MGWKITSVRMTDEEWKELLAEKEATGIAAGTILLDAWRGKRAGREKQNLVTTETVSQPLPAQTPPEGEQEVKQ